MKKPAVEEEDEDDAEAARTRLFSLSIVRYLRCCLRSLVLAHVVQCLGSAAAKLVFERPLVFYKRNTPFLRPRRRSRGPTEIVWPDKSVTGSRCPPPSNHSIRIEDLSIGVAVRYLWVYHPRRWLVEAIKMVDCCSHLPIVVGV